MNILDIAQNSVRAEATLVEITLRWNTAEKSLALTIQDNGKGMSEEMVRNVTDPFCTTRTTRKVGLGVPFLKMAAEMAGGRFAIHSTLGVGTEVKATFKTDHIDLAPLGDMAGTAAALVQTSPDIDFVFRFVRDEREFAFDTREARQMLGDVPLSEPSVAIFVREFVEENLQELTKQEI